MTSLTEVTRSACRLIAGCTLAALLAAPAAAQEPAALVIDVTGPTTPAVGAFDELPAGASLELGAKTEITLSHYASCEEVALRGGTVKVLPADVGYSGSTVLSAVKTECPQPVKMHKSDLIGAVVVLRSVKPRPEVSQTPNFLVAVHEGDYDRISIQLGTDVLVSRKLTGPRVIWNRTDPPLKPGEYTVILSGAGDRMHAAQIKVAPGGSGTLVLRP